MESQATNKSNLTVTITFNNADDKNNEVLKNHCYETNGANLNVMVTPQNHTHGSSLVTLKSLVDYRWDEKDYPGRLIAIHKSGQVIAYSINVNGQGMVRVAHYGLNVRALIKGMSKEVLDLEFAYITPDIIIGIIEEEALHIHKLEILDNTMSCTQLLKIENPLMDYVPKLDKITWCPYLPESSDDEDELSGQLLVWVRGKRFECYSIRTILDVYKSGTHEASKIQEGFVKKYDGTSIITSARFSPDGTALAISDDEGYISFYQIYFHESTPRCLHKWKPHNGHPISSFFFLDNHTMPIPGNSLWKYAVTFADNNTEMKISSCETWETLQTISFKSSTGIPLIFKTEIDKTSSYLVLSDRHNRQIYVLQIKKDNDTEKALNLNGSDGGYHQEKELDSQISKVSVKTISCFNLSSSILSYGINCASITKSKCALNDNFLIDELEDYDEESSAVNCVQLDLYMVQPKSVQQCCIRYQPALNQAAEVLGSTTENLLVYENPSSLKPLSEKSNSALNISQNEATSSKSDISSNFIKTPPQKSVQLNLLTPDSFRSPIDKKPDNNNVSQEVRSAIFMLANTASTSVKASSPQAIPQKPMENVLNLVKTEENLLKQSQVKIIPIDQPSSVQGSSTILSNNSNSGNSNEVLISGGSSPSREVREILSLKESVSEFGEDSDSNMGKDEFKSLLNDLNLNPNCEFRNIDDDDLDEDEENNDLDVDEDGNEEDDEAEDDENDGKILKENKNSNKTEWPKAPEVPLIDDDEAAIQMRGPNLKVLEDRMSKMIEIMEQQSRYIAELRHEIYNLKEKQNTDTMIVKNISVRSEENVKKIMEESYAKQERQNHQKFENLLQIRDKQNREFRESVLQMIHQVMMNQLTEKIAAIFVSELQRQFLPMIASKLEVMKVQIHRDIADKFATNETFVKDSLFKICGHETFINALGQSVLTGIHKNVETSFRRAMEIMLIPSYEKITREMFKDLGRAFTEGTKEYTRAFDAYMRQYGAMEDRSKELNDSVNKLPLQIRSQTESLLLPIFRESMEDIRKKLEKLEVNLLKDIKDQVKTEIQNGFELQQLNLEDSVLSAFRSQAHTPAPSSIFESQETIKQHLQHGQIDKAFHTALIANDLALVDFIIEKADFKKVFGPCTLTQNVLLSLIQQLTADTQNYNELKNKYVHEAVLSLDMSDSVTREHAPKIMRDLYQHLQSFITSNSNNPLNSNIKMIMLAAQSIMQPKTF